MSKLRLLLAAGWCVAGLLALKMTLRAQAMASAGRPGSVIEAIRTRCELPANTVVFVVRPGAAGEER